MRFYKEEILEKLKNILLLDGIQSDMITCINRVLLLSEMSGEFAHGLRMFNMYRHLLHNYKTFSCVKTIIETPSFSVEDCEFLPGPYTASKCMQKAIEKASSVGIYVVLARHANTYGPAFVYALQAAQQGFIGITMSNTPAQMPVFRGEKRMLGTNPLCYSVPANVELPIIFDMATSKVAKSRINLAYEMNQDIPDDWGVDKYGNMTTKPKDVLDGGMMLPFVNSPKGYGVAMMVDLFAGLLSGGACLDDVGFFKTGRMNVGQLFVAADPTMIYGDDFYSAVDSYIRKVKTSGDNVRLPGENKLNNIKKAECNGIEIEEALYNQLFVN